MLARNIWSILSLIGVMALIKIFDLTIGPNHVYPGRTAVFPWAELGLTAVFGIVGAALAARTAVIQVLPSQERYGISFLRAGILGAVLGVVLCGMDSWLRIGDANVGLPLAPVFYLWGGISQETLSHFAPAAILIGAISFLSASVRVQDVAFWIISFLASGLAAFGMMAAFSMPEVPLHPQVENAPIIIAAAVFVIELALFVVFRKSGFIAALSMRLGFYGIWHVIWPSLAY